MRYSFSICFIILCFISLPKASTQNLSPVKWGFELKLISGDEYEIIAIATMPSQWVIYSQFSDDNGPIPTQFFINENIQKMEEKSKSIKEFDAMFDVEVLKFKNEAIFTKRVLKSESDRVKGYVTFMTCDGTKCLPPKDVAFDLKY